MAAFKTGRFVLRAFDAERLPVRSQTAPKTGLVIVLHPRRRSLQIMPHSNRIPKVAGPILIHN